MTTISSISVGQVETRLRLNKPSRFKLPQVNIEEIAPHDDFPETWLRRLISSLWEQATDIYSIAESINADTHLSAEGKLQKIAAEVFKLYAHYVTRVNDYVPSVVEEIRKTENDLKDKFREERQKLNMDNMLLSEIRQYLRGLTVEQRNALIRRASQGQVENADEIMEATATVYPALVGFAENDPTLKSAKNKWIGTKFPRHIEYIEKSESLLTDVEQGDAWLLNYTKSVVADVSYEHNIDALERERLAEVGKDSG